MIRRKMFASTKDLHKLGTGIQKSFCASLPHFKSTRIRFLVSTLVKVVTTQVALLSTQLIVETEKIKLLKLVARY